MKRDLSLCVPARRVRDSSLESSILTAKSSCDAGPRYVLGSERDKNRSLFFPVLRNFKSKVKQVEGFPVLKARRQFKADAHKDAQC